MKKVFLLTEAFPAPNVEQFLQAEIAFGASNCNLVIIPISTYNTAEKHIALPENVRVDYSLITETNRKKHRYINSLCLCSMRLYCEVPSIMCRIKHVETILYQALRWIYYGRRAYRYISKAYAADLSDPKNPPVVYAYWLAAQAVAASELKKKFPHIHAIARCHGYDCQPQRHEGNYIATLRYTIRHLDALYPVSQYSASTVSVFNTHGTKCKVAYLGTNDHGVIPLKEHQPFTIVSCSSCIEVKRIDLLIKALSLIKGHDIHWIHIGAGPLMADLKELAASVFGANITYDFKGAMLHEDVMRFYSQHYAHLFINTSSSEGMSVSIMEALSFGLPVLATDAGGNKEGVIDDHNGYIVPVDCSSETLSEYINKMIDLPTERIIDFKKNSRTLWTARFSAKNNYESFYHEVLDF